MKDIVKKLHPHERKILLALKELGIASPAQISKKTKLPVSAVHKASLWAGVKGLTKHEIQKRMEAVITPEGKEYAKVGFPERRLLVLLAKGKATPKKLKKEIPNLNIALAWAKRKKWIVFEGNNIVLTEEGKKILKTETKIEKNIKEENYPYPSPEFEELKKRKLIKAREKKEKIYALTKKGEMIIPRIKKEKFLYNQLTPQDLITGDWRRKVLRPYDVKTPVPTINAAKMHPYTQFLNKIRKRLTALGFQETKGPFIETGFWNFDALFIPQDHPARGIHGIFKLKKPKTGMVKNKRALEWVEKTHKNGWITGSLGWGQWNLEETLKTIMRSQTTSVSARNLTRKFEPPAKFFSLDRNFRPDMPDQTHSFEFFQCDCIVIGENLTLEHLLGYLEIFGKEIAGAKKVRFRPGYFPFTEPSVELDCLVNGKWIEVAGSGIFRPEVTQPLGINQTVLAWGAGVDRLAMIKMGIDDMRTLFTSDLEWLRKRPITL